MSTPTPDPQAPQMKEALHALVDDLYTAYCDYQSRDKNKDRFRNLVTAFLNSNLTATRQQLEEMRKERDAVKAENLRLETYLSSRILVSLGDGTFAAVDKSVVECHDKIRSQLTALQSRLDRAEAALKTIAEWHGHFPASGRFWKDNKGRDTDVQMSYSAAFGSNGERDYMRALARAALTNNGGGKNEKEINS